MTETKSKIREILEEVIDERVSQDTKWGIQNHKSVSDNPNTDYEISGEYSCKMACEIAARNNNLTWADIAIEELSEAVYAGNEKLRREELVQTAAVILAWIECIDRNKDK